MASVEPSHHHCSCPREKQNIVSRNGYNNIDEQPFEFKVCTNCGVSNCASSDTQNKHNHNWNSFAGKLMDMFILRCNISGCKHTVYVCGNNRKNII